MLHITSSSLDYFTVAFLFTYPVDSFASGFLHNSFNNIRFSGYNYRIVKVHISLFILLSPVMEG